MINNSNTQNHTLIRASNHNQYSFVFSARDFHFVFRALSAANSPSDAALCDCVTVTFESTVLLTADSAECDTADTAETAVGSEFGCAATSFADAASSVKHAVHTVPLQYTDRLPRASLAVPSFWDRSSWFWWHLLPSRLADPFLYDSDYLLVCHSLYSFDLFSFRSSCPNFLCPESWNFKVDKLHSPDPSSTRTWRRRRRAWRSERAARRVESFSVW